jgi:hypothetical protein
VSFLDFGWRAAGTGALLAGDPGTSGDQVLSLIGTCIIAVKKAKRRLKAL